MITVLAMACGGSTTAGPAAPRSSGNQADCGSICGGPSLHIAPKPPVSPCDGPPGGLLGKVQVDGKPPEEPIKLVAVSSCTRFPVESNDKGVFSLPSLPEGVYVVEARVGTAARAFGEVTVRPGEVVALELELRGDEVARGREELAAREKCGCPLHR